MTQSTAKQTARGRRIFPEQTLSPEELGRSKAEDELFMSICFNEPHTAKGGTRRVGAKNVKVRGLKG